jgi:hypothetical protein
MRSRHLKTTFAQSDRKEKGLIITGRVANFEGVASQKDIKIIVFNLLSQSTVNLFTYHYYQDNISDIRSYKTLWLRI